MDELLAKWNDITENLRIEHDLGDVSFKTWIKPLKVFRVTDDTVFILVNIQASVDYINNKFKLPLQVCIAEAMNQEYEVIFITEKEASSFEDLSQDDINTTYTESNGLPKDIILNANLNEKYTFDTFVVGKNNQFAHAASLAVAESPGKVYNPLFIYGGVGLGKTHLMHSIARFVLEQDQTKKVLYVTSETFTNELINAIKIGKTGNGDSMNSFRDKYRNNDVLLIDDIQFIIGKESTQEEFFHTFNHLYQAGKQIIISSDKPPKEINTLEARLRTRFEWGLTADISSPDYETRMAILKKKIELDGMGKYKISDEVLEYIANNIKSNIRELEGSLNKLIAYANLQNKEINIELAADALKDMISPGDVRTVTPELIMDIVSEHFNISVADLKSKKRTAEIALPRQIVMYLCREMTETPLKSVGIILGGKDHSTVSHGVNKIESDIQTDESFANTINILKKKISPF